MSTSTSYYQVGGWQGHLKAIPDLRLLHPPDGQGLSLVLGILPNGASYLLLPGSRYNALRWRLPYGDPHTPERFMSLSPISFSSFSELEAKLKWYASTKSNKNIAKDKRKDRSKANGSYTVAGDRPSDAGRVRSSFEMQRVFVLTRPMLAKFDDYQAAELALKQLPEQVNVVSLCYNAWKADTRTLREREADPRVLDIGWTTWSKPTAWNDLIPSDTTHIIVQDDRLLGNPGSKRIECEYATTTYQKRSEIAWHLGSALTGRHPVVLLVHDEARTLTTLRALGVNTTEWVSGIAGLLYGDTRGPVRTTCRPSRSRSPGRRGSDAQDLERRPSGTPVYVVDVRSLYLAMKQIAPTADSMPINARGLGVSLDPPKDKSGAVTSSLIAESDRWWCAGTESLLLGKMWYSMARGPNIDDQRTLRWATSMTAARQEDNILSPDTPLHPPEGADGGASDDDVDPNDIIPTAAAPSSSSKPGIGEKALRLMDPDGWDDASDDDW